MRQIPASVILSFPAPNYVDPETRGDALIVTNSIFISFVAIAMSARLYTRVFITKCFGLDDVLAILAFIFAVGLMATVTLANDRYGWDRHVWDVPFGLIPAAGKTAFTAKLLFTFAVVATRLSILTFYYRMVGSTVIRWFRWALHASVAYNLAILITYICLVVFLCDPPSAYWKYPLPAGAKCLDEGKVVLAAGVINCVADFLVNILPIPVVMRLQMPFRRRLGVMLLLSVGFIVTIAGVVRTYYCWKGLMDSWDQTWFTFPLWISAAVEVDLAVICACVPYLRPLFAQVVGPKLSAMSERLNEKLSSRSRDSSKNVSNKGSIQAVTKISTEVEDIELPIMETRNKNASRGVEDV